MFSKLKFTKKDIQKIAPKATITPLVTPPNEIAVFNSISPKGGKRISTIFPCIFEINKDEDKAQNEDRDREKENKSRYCKS